MAKRDRDGVRGKERQVEVQRSVPLAGVLVRAGQAFHELAVATGLQVLSAMLEQDRESLCGPRSQPDEQRRAYRHGYDRGWLVLGGRRVVVDKPRVRRMGGGEEVLPSWAELSAADPLEHRTVEQLLLGVSTRRYERSLETLPTGLRSVGAKPSSVSRRFVAATRAQVATFLSRPLDTLALPVIMIDGTGLGDHLLLVALGIDTEGEKHVLGAWEGSSESVEVGRGLLRNLIERGLSVEQPRLFVVDGSKGLRKAITQTFGRWARIQRCQVHKTRNILEHLPEARRPWVHAQLRKAWAEPNAPKARRQLLRLADALEDQHPSAAASIREGLDEILTLAELGVTGALHRTLRSTNPIENLQEAIQRTARRVKRWRGGTMALRWAVAALQEAHSGFRKVRGYRDLPRLVHALQRAVQPLEHQLTVDSLEKVA